VISSVDRNIIFYMRKLEFTTSNPPLIHVVEFQLLCTLKKGELLITIVFIILPTFDGILNRLRSGKRLKRGRWEQLLMWYINNVTLHRSPSSNIKFFD
jgi:hypothetical protein